MTTRKYLFATFDVSRQVFFKSKLSLGMVNLKPLLPGHVLVLPRRLVPRLADLRPDEVSDLFGSVQSIGRVLEGLYEAQALTISLQDGVAAGQSVPHVHIHIIPRQASDLKNNDDIYPAIERAEQRLSSELEGRTESQNRTTIQDLMPRDEDRKPRTEQEMADEAGCLRAAMVDAGLEMEAE